MERRELLRVVAPAGLIGIAGCSSIVSTQSSSNSCEKENNYDKLTVKLRSENKPTSDSTVVIHYKELNSNVQKVINKSINGNEVKQCHKFNESQSDIKSFWNYISNKWSKVGGSKSEKADYTYLKKDGRYYGIQLIILDTLRVGSIPNS